VEGSGNGIKTVIPNMVDIAKSLSRPPTCTRPARGPAPLPGLIGGVVRVCLADPTKFFGIELGAQTQMDDAIGRYIVNGQHTAEDLAKLLDRFIKKFVLCGKCGNPETDMVRASRTSPSPFPRGR
jgi:translation initiation factor 5